MQLENDSDHPLVATHVLSVMIRGVFFKLEFPYAHFGTTRETGSKFSHLYRELFDA